MGGIQNRLFIKTVCQVHLNKTPSITILGVLIPVVVIRLIGFQEKEYSVVIAKDEM